MVILHVIKVAQDVAWRKAQTFVNGESYDKSAPLFLLHFYCSVLLNYLLRRCSRARPDRGQRRALMLSAIPGNNNNNRPLWIKSTVTHMGFRSNCLLFLITS